MILAILTSVVAGVIAGVLGAGLVIWLNTPKRPEDTVPCPIAWPTCAPDGCRLCDGTGGVRRDVADAYRANRTKGGL